MSGCNERQWTHRLTINWYAVDGDRQAPSRQRARNLRYCLRQMPARMCMTSWSHAYVRMYVPTDRRTETSQSDMFNHVNKSDWATSCPACKPLKVGTTIFWSTGSGPVDQIIRYPVLFFLLQPQNESNYCFDRNLQTAYRSAVYYRSWFHRMMPKLMANKVNPS